MRVVVLAGGRSSEHDVSLASGRAVADGLREAGHEVLEVVIGRHGDWRRDDEPISVIPGRGLLGADVVFPALHGPFGEDGTVQGLLECLDVAYVGAGVLASAVCLDKIVFKDLMARAGLPQVDYLGVTAARWREDPGGVRRELEPLGLPVFVKPARLGSSVGIARVAQVDELDRALEAALALDPRVIVEAGASGLEVECSVLGLDAPEVSRLGEIVLTREGWYDYEAKYTPGGMELAIPARISERAAQRVCALALEAFERSAVDGMARVDFFVDGETVLLNELNTIPGFTQTSVFAKLFAASGVAYPRLLDRLVTLAQDRRARDRGF